MTIHHLRLSIRLIYDTKFNFGICILYRFLHSFIKSGEFFKAAQRSGLWSEAQAVHRSAVTRAGKKVSWTVFRNILKDAVALAYQLCFHGKPPNTIRQELYAVLIGRIPYFTGFADIMIPMAYGIIRTGHSRQIHHSSPVSSWIYERHLQKNRKCALTIMSIIARTLMVLTRRVHGPSTAVPVHERHHDTGSRGRPIHTPVDPQKAVAVFSEILAAISRVKYYKAQISQSITAQRHQETSQ